MKYNMNNIFGNRQNIKSREKSSQDCGTLEVEASHNETRSLVSRNFEQVRKNMMKYTNLEN